MFAFVQAGLPDVVQLAEGIGFSVDFDDAINDVVVIAVPGVPGKQEWRVAVAVEGVAIGGRGDFADFGRCVYDDRDLLLKTVSLVVDNLDSVGNEILHRERGNCHGGRYGVAATTVQDVFAVIPVVPHLVLVGVRRDMDDQGGGIVGIDLERIK